MFLRASTQGKRREASNGVVGRNAGLGPGTKSVLADQASLARVNLSSASRRATLWSNQEFPLPLRALDFHFDVDSEILQDFSRQLTVPLKAPRLVPGTTACHWQPGVHLRTEGDFLINYSGFLVATF